MNEQHSAGTSKYAALCSQLRERLITVPKPGSKPFTPTPNFWQTMTIGGVHKPGDSAGCLGLLNFGFGPHQMQEHIYAVDPLCEEAAQALEALGSKAHENETECGGWFPMESANVSKLFASSTWVLLHTDAGMVTEAIPHYFDGGGYIWMTARGENVRGSDDERNHMLRVKPLHWRPLPSPPGAELKANAVDPRHCPQCGPHPNDSSEEHTRKAHTFGGLFGDAENGNPR